MNRRMVLNTLGHIALAEALIAQDKLMVAGNFICLKHLVTEKRIHQWGIADDI